MAAFIREKPPLRLSVSAAAPSGSTQRWGPDEPDPANVPTLGPLTTTVPGGFETFSAILPRRPEVNYADLERLSTLTVMGAGGQVAWEGRLESAPRVSGNQMSVAPQAVGWQAHLDDNPAAMAVYVDRDLSHWQSMSRTRRLAIIASAFTPADGQVDHDPTTGLPSLTLALTGNGSAIRQQCELFYDAGPGAFIGSIYYDFVRGANTTVSSEAYVGTDSTDAFSSATLTSDLCAQVSIAGTLTAGADERYGLVTFLTPSASGGTNGLAYEITVRRVVVWGDHGLTKRGTAPDDGLYASDVVAHAVREWAPLLNLTTGADGSVTDTSFVIPHLEFREPATAGQIVSAANRYHLRDWAVWEGKTFHYYDRGARGKSWRARVAPAQLEEAGPSIENLFNGVIVRFQDVDGTTKTVGPTGSGADTISDSVADADPSNPANELGMKRWATLDMGGVSTPAGATEVGRRFLVESAQYNTSGRAQLVGHVEDDRGVLYPAWRVRGGDTISFVDAAYTSPRRIVRTSYDPQSKANSVDLDAPAEGLEALLQRLQVSLVGVI